MRAVVQRVKRCSVATGDEVISRGGEGLLVLLGVQKGDGAGELEYLAEKILNLRVFPDEEGRMNRSVLDIEGDLIVVSQFTLLADTRKGRRPSFAAAEEPEKAESIYERFVERLRDTGLEVGTGSFGAMMLVSLDNWGPVTLVIDSPPR